MGIMDVSKVLCMFNTSNFEGKSWNISQSLVLCTLEFRLMLARVKIMSKILCSKGPFKPCLLYGTL